MILARDEDHPSPGEGESDEDKTELPELELVPDEGGEGAFKAEPCDAKQADQAYIEALELIKFDTAELVVRSLIVFFVVLGYVTTFAPKNNDGNTTLRIPETERVWQNMKDCLI